MTRKGLDDNKYEVTLWWKDEGAPPDVEYNVFVNDKSINITKQNNIGIVFDRGNSYNVTIYAQRCAGYLISNATDPLVFFSRKYNNNNNYF